MREMTQSYLKECLDYDGLTGVFTWRERPREHFKCNRVCKRWNTIHSGNVAGSIDSYGYWQITIGNKFYRAHRLAWLWMTGELPARQIDHICGDKLNNSFANLRPATHGQNLRNRGAQSNNMSGRKGVSWNKKASKWSVQIDADGCRSHLGFYDEDKLDDAASAYERAAKELHGEFARVS